jgi:DNA-binding XRE family transcriptional regulator
LFANSLDGVFPINESLDSYIRNRANTLGLTLTEMCRIAKISRQSFYALNEVPNKLPDLKTIISLAEVLQVHPLRLLHLVFDRVPMHKSAKRSARGDQSAFLADVTFPDGTLVLPNQTFTKTWKIQNVGKVAWKNRYLQCMDEEIVVTTRTGEVLQLGENLISQNKRVAIPLTEAGNSVLVSVDFTAPTLPMTVLSYWKAVFEDGSLCFPKSVGLWCKVRVTTLVAAASDEH